MFAVYEGKLEYGNRTHLWCEMEDGSIEVAKDDGCSVHADYFGQWAWDTQNRGYVFEEESVVTIHGCMDRTIERKLAAELTDIVYKMDVSNTNWV